MEKVSIAIIGAGVVGLAIAQELSKKYKDIVLVEKEASFGQETSSRNSEIIHAGIYYPKESLKAKLCVAGKQLLYDYCQQNKVPCQKLGKLIVATAENEVGQLEELKQKGLANGVEDLELIAKSKAKELEPSVNAYAALCSPSTGIIDSHLLMKSLEQEAKKNGVMISYDSEVTAINKSDSGYLLQINHEYDFQSKVVINVAGLFSDKIAAMAGIDIMKNKYRLYYCKGEYFSYQKGSFIKSLVYPVPEPNIAGLGVHAVIDLAGGLKFGPSAEYVAQIDYKVNPKNRVKFFASVKKLFPKVKEDELQPDQAGVRPKLQGPGEGIRDFVINEESKNGLPGFINLIGIESPGLTACLAIAKQVAALIS